MFLRVPPNFLKSRVTFQGSAGLQGGKGNDEAPLCSTKALIDIDDLVNDGGAVRFDRGFLGQVLSTPYHLSFAPVGDLTGDGIADFAIGFPGAPMGLKDDLTGDPLAGEIIYLKGASRRNWGKVIDLRNPSLDFKRVHGSTPDAFLCRLLVLAGDVNGDGHKDLLAAPRSDRGGLVYLLFGRSWDQMADDDPVDNAYLAGGGGIAITVAEGVERSPDRFHVASAGDANGDGYDDLSRIKRLDSDAVSLLTWKFLAGAPHVHGEACAAIAG